MTKITPSHVYIFEWDLVYDNLYIVVFKEFCYETQQINVLSHQHSQNSPIQRVVYQVPFENVYLQGGYFGHPIPDSRIF